MESKLSRNVVEHTVYDQRELAPYLDPKEAAEEFRELLVDGAGKMATFPDLVEDSFYSLYKFKPQLLDKEEVTATRHANRGLMERAMESPLWSKLRSNTRGDADLSALATLAMSRQILESVPEEVKKAVNDAVQREQKPRGEESLDGGEGAGEPVPDLGDVLDANSRVLDQAIAQGLEAAEKEVDAQRAMVKSWGHEKGTAQKMSVAERLALSKRLQRNTKFQQVAELLGRYKALAISKVEERVEDPATEIVDIEHGRNLERMTPQGMLGLVEPSMAAAWDVAYLEGNLPQYRMEGKETRGRGPIVVCWDESRSMMGQKEVWAKAVALSLLHVSYEQKRHWYGIAFASAGQVRVYRMDGSESQKVFMETTLNVAEGFLNGGPLRVDQRVATPEGWRPIGGLRIGDEVFGRNGCPTKVTGVFPQGLLDLYEVEFTDGAKVICDKSHLWTVATNVGHKVVEKTLTLAEIMAKGLDEEFEGRVNRRHRYNVPVAKALDLPARELPLDPYLMGCLLGDGAFSGSAARMCVGRGEEQPWRHCLPPGITVVDYEKRGLEYAHQFALVPNQLATGKAARNAVTNSLRSLGLMGLTGEWKFIPEPYLWASREQRWALLQGLLDTDGCAVPLSGAEFYTISDKLAAGVVQLVQSLGGLATASLKTSVRSNERPIWRIKIQLDGPDAPFRLARKRSRWVVRKRLVKRAITAIRPVAPGEAVCIKVAAPDGLFLTEGMVVTHNTDYATPLQKALEAIGSQPGLKDADLVFVTDDECRISPGFLDEYRAKKKALGFHAVGVFMGYGKAPVLESFCDQVLPFESWRGVGDAEASHIFQKVS